MKKRIFTKTMSSRSYEEDGYWHNLELLIILHNLCVSYPMRSELKVLV